MLPEFRQWRLPTGIRVPGTCLVLTSSTVAVAFSCLERRAAAGHPGAGSLELGSPNVSGAGAGPAGAGRGRGGGESGARAIGRRAWRQEGTRARPHPEAAGAYRRERRAQINVARWRGRAALSEGLRHSHAVPAPGARGCARRGSTAVRAHAAAAARSPDALLHRRHPGSRARRAHAHPHAAIPQLLLHQPRVLLPDPGVRAHAGPPRLLAPPRRRAGRRLRLRWLRRPSVLLPADGERLHARPAPPRPPG